MWRGGVSVFSPATSVTPIQVHFPTEQRRCRHGGGGHLRGAAGASPRPLDSGRLLPPLLALGFSDGYKAYPAPPAPGASLVFQQDWAGGCPAAACRASGVQRPQGRPWRPRCLQGPAAGCPAFQRPRLLPQTPSAHPSVLLFFLPILSPPSPRIIFLCINNSPVRKQYHFRSKDERDINLVEGKFSFTV